MHTQQKRREIDTREFNKNVALNKYTSIDKLDEKVKDSYNFDLPPNGTKHTDGANDPFVEAGEKGQIRSKYIFRQQRARIKV